jgi:hypothetical protein
LGNSANGTVFTAGNAGYYFVGWGRQSNPNRNHWGLNTNNSNSWVMPMGYMNIAGEFSPVLNCPMGSQNNYATVGTTSSFVYMHYQGRVNGGQALKASKGGSNSNSDGGYYGTNWTWNS